MIENNKKLENKENNLVEYAKNELRILCPEPDETQQAVHDGILAAVKIFSAEDPSSTVADNTSHALRILSSLLHHIPLTPLTGEPDEWYEDDDGSGGTLYRNRRCFDVIKPRDIAYHTKGRVFSDDNGKTWYTSNASIVAIESFPYTVPSYPEHIINPLPEVMVDEEL